MKYGKVLPYFYLGVGLAVASFIFDALMGRTDFSLSNFTTFLVSAAMGTTLGALYYQFIGYRFPKFKFLFSIIFSLAISTVIKIIAVEQSWIIHDLTILVSCCLAVLYSFDNKKVNVEI